MNSSTKVSCFLSISPLVSPWSDRFFFSSRRRHTSSGGDWSSDVCSSDLQGGPARDVRLGGEERRQLGEGQAAPLPLQAGLGLGSRQGLGRRGGGARQALVALGLLPPGRQERQCLRLEQPLPAVPGLAPVGRDAGGPGAPQVLGLVG